MVERRTLQSLAFNGVALTGGLAIMFVPDILSIGHAPGDGPSVMVRTIAVMVSLAWASFFAVNGFRRADEFVQERSKFAWYWGSLIGLLIGVPLFALVAWGGLNGALPGSELAPRAARSAFAMGLGLPLAAQVLGFAAVSLWWRATKR